MMNFSWGVEDAAPYNNGIYLILYINIFRRGAPHVGARKMFIELCGIHMILLYLLVCTGDHAAIQFKIFYIFDRDNKRNICNTDLKIKCISGIIHIFLIQDTRFG